MGNMLMIELNTRGQRVNIHKTQRVNLHRIKMFNTRCGTQRVNIFDVALVTC